MQCTTDFDLEELESRLYSQVFHSTEDWEPDPVTPNMILNDTSNRQVSNYAIHNVSVPNATRYWCGQNSALIPLPPIRPPVPYPRVHDEAFYETRKMIRNERKLKRQLDRRQKKLDKKKERLLGRKIQNKLGKKGEKQLAQLISIGVLNSATTNNDTCSNNNASHFVENNVGVSMDSLCTSAMFADDSIIYQHINVPSQIQKFSAEETKVEDLPVAQPDEPPTSMPINDNRLDIIVLSDSDSDSVMEIPLPDAPVYSIDSSNDSDSSVCSIQDQPIITSPISPIKNDTRVLGSCEHTTNEQCDGKIVTAKVSEKLKDESEINEIVSIEQDNHNMKEKVMDETEKAKETANTKTAADVAEEERNEFLHTPDSNTNDFIENDVNNINKNVHFFNFTLHGSDLDLSNKDPEKLNRATDVPSTDIYETESSCSEAGTIISKGPVFQEIDFESPTKEIFCEPDLVSFSNFITPIRKNKSTKKKDSANSRPVLTQVKTKALSIIEKKCHKPAKDVESKVDEDEAHDNPCNDSDEYNSDAMTLHVKKKNKKKKKKSKKNKDKLNSEADNENEVQESSNYDTAFVGESNKKSVTSNKEMDNKYAASEKSKKSSSKNANDDEVADVEKINKAANKTEFDENSDKYRNKKHLQDKQMRMQSDDKINDKEKYDDIIKYKSKKQKKSKDTEEQSFKSALPSTSENDYNSDKVLSVNDDKNREERVHVQDKQEEFYKNNTAENISEIDIKENIEMESNSADNEGLKQFSFVGAWNKLNTETPSENQVGIALGLNTNTSTEQHKSSIFNLNQNIAQIDPIRSNTTVFNMNKNTEQYKSPMLNVIQNTSQNELVGVQLNTSTEQADQDKLSIFNLNKIVDQSTVSDSNLNKNTIEEKSFDTNLNHNKSSSSNLNKSTIQDKSPSPSVTKNIVEEISPDSSLHESTDQVKLSESNLRKSFILSEYISLIANENTEPNDTTSFSKKTPDMETDNDVVLMYPDRSHHSKTSNTDIEQIVLSDGPSTSKKPKKTDKASDVIVLSSDSDSDMEFSPKIEFYKDLGPDYSNNIVLNTSTSSEIDNSNLNTNNPSSYNIVINPFSVNKIKQSFKDFWTADMKMFYDESWGQENYDLQQVLSSMPSDKAKWKIVPEDQKPARSPRKRGPVCMRCREPGHPQYRCPKYSGPIKCSTCGGTGHYHTRCPNLMCTTCGNKGGYHTTSCYKCAHYGRIKCTLCNMFGHLNTECPDLWRRYHLTTQETQNLRTSQSSLKPVNERWCANCSRRGHFQDSCSYLKFEHFPTNSKIMSYDPMYNRDFKLETQPEKNIPTLPDATLSDIRNYKHTVIADNSKKYENILKTLKRQCLKSNLQFLDQINKLEKCIKNNQINKKNIGNIYKIRSLIHKYSRDS